MKTIKELSKEVFRLQHELYLSSTWRNNHSKPTNAWAIDIARDMINYCKYLQDVLTNFKRVTVSLDEHNALRVHYVNGSSKIMVDTIYEKLLLPEIEAILKQCRKKIKYTQELKQAA